MPRPWHGLRLHTSMVRPIVFDRLLLSNDTLGMSRRRSPPIRPPSPIIVLISLLWTFWDRTWLQVRRAQGRGLSLRETGRKESIVSLEQVLLLSYELTRAVANTVCSLGVSSRHVDPYFTLGCQNYGGYFRGFPGRRSCRKRVNSNMICGS
jgi:hypothetical protein